MTYNDRITLVEKTPLDASATAHHPKLYGCWVGHIWCGFRAGKKNSGTRIIIKKISRPFRVHLGAGWGGLQQEPLDDKFYK
jgi:hypothetical protein